MSLTPPRRISSSRIIRFNHTPPRSATIPCIGLSTIRTAHTLETLRLWPSRAWAWLAARPRSISPDVAVRALIRDHSPVIREHDDALTCCALRKRIPQEARQRWCAFASWVAAVEHSLMSDDQVNEIAGDRMMTTGTDDHSQSRAGRPASYARTRSRRLAQRLLFLLLGVAWRVCLVVGLGLLAFSITCMVTQPGGRTDSLLDLSLPDMDLSIDMRSARIDRAGAITIWVYPVDYGDQIVLLMLPGTPPVPRPRGWTPPREHPVPPPPIVAPRWRSG